MIDNEGVRSDEALNCNAHLLQVDSVIPMHCGD